MRILRSVLTASDKERMKIAGNEPTDPPDNIFKQIGKSVPAEVLAIYLPLVQGVNMVSAGDPKQIGSWILFVLGLVFTIGYAYIEFHKEHAYGVALKVTMATVAFVAWSSNLGGYIGYVSWWDSLYSTIFAGAVAGATPIVYWIYNIVTKPKPK